MRHHPRRSTSVTLTLLSGIATAVLAACRGGEAEQRHCVDQQDRVVPDSLCKNAARPRSGTGSGIGAAAMWYPYRYYYGGAGYAGIGSRMRGGSYAPVQGGRGRSSASRSGTARGGFGGIGGGRSIGG
jgi:hypothetical protein